MAPRPSLAAVLVVALLAWAAPARAVDPDPVGVWPLEPEPEVVAAFDPPDSPWGAGHRGVDLLGTAGRWVRAALPGRVTYAGVLAGRGVVVVDHGSTRTTYEPVDASVPVGTVVSAGDRIGRLSAAGSHCLPRVCLHWGWIEGETYLDPLRLVGAGPVRLLPLWRDLPAAYAGWRSPLRLFLATPVGAPAGRPGAAGPW
jgi:murein DD-endopeptidase MepM/ murein hydrolase activator NlpD